ncbi:MAG: winged helix-turn-helix domain-containing protein [Thermoprotei archaeon]
MSEKKTTKEIILEVLKKEKRPLTPKEIQKLTNLNYNTIRGRLQDLKKAGLVIRTDEGWIYKEYLEERAKKEEEKKRRRRKK